MNLKQFRYALTLAKEGSFSKAADVLGVSQPSLSQYVKKIEEETGALLFDRQGSNLRLTDAGKIYIDTGRRILELEHKMQQDFISIASYKTGNLVIGAAPYRSAGFTPQACALFRQKYPGISITIDERGTSALLSGVLHNEFDFAISVLPVDDTIYSYEIIKKEEILLAVPKNSDLNSLLMPNSTIVDTLPYPVVDLALVNLHHFVMITETQYMQQLLMRYIAQKNLTLQTAVTVRSLEAQILMVKAGLGAAIVPQGIEQFGGFEKISYYCLADIQNSRTVAAIWRKGDELSLLAKEFIEILKRS